MIFSDNFNHNFLSTKKVCVKFVSLESKHLGLQFEQNFCLIWIYIEWVMTVWSWAIKAIRLGFLGRMCTHESCMHTHGWDLHTEANFMGSRTSFLRAQNIILWCGPAPKPWECPKTIKKPLKTLLLTNKYSSYVSNQNAS